MNLFKIAIIGLVGVGMLEKSYGFGIDTNSLPKNFVLNQAADYESKALLLIDTLSPSGKYIFAVTGKDDDNELHILSATTFKDLAPPIQTSCLFIQKTPRFKTLALWNKQEDRVALQTGGRTWTDVYLVTFEKGKLNLMQRIDGQNEDLILKKIPAAAKVTRLYIDCSPYISSKWIDKDSVTVEYSGSVQLKNGDFQE